MFTTAVDLADTDKAAIALPWFVKVSPEFYDDPSDTGYGWEGWALSADDAIAQALDQCHRDNDRDPDQHAEDIDPMRAKVHIAEIDFRRFAGPLVYWARMMGGWESLLWDAMEAAVAAAGLTVVPFSQVTGRQIEPTGNIQDHQFLFDVKLFAAIQVAAADEASARRMLTEALDCASVNAGAWPNGESILFEVSQDGEADLIEIDGEPFS